MLHAHSDHHDHPIIPFQSEMVPLFLLMSDLGLVDTHAAIVLPAMITPFAVFSSART